MPPKGIDGMKKRIITSLIGLPIVFFVFFVYDTLLFNALIGVASAIAVYEMLVTTKYIKHKMLVWIGVVQAIFIPFSFEPSLEPFGTVSLMAFLIVMLAVMFFRHHEVRFEEVAMTFFVSFAIPYAFSYFVLLRTVEPTLGVFFIILPFTCSWLCDSGAYFVGRVFGKRKLAPKISPNKTVEGAVGGVVIAVVLNIALTYVYMWVMTLTTKQVITVHFGSLCLVLLICIISSILGDLTASIIKRQCDVKDFGKLFPGHGGIMDRFDSTIFVIPLLYTLVTTIPIITIAT